MKEFKENLKRLRLETGYTQRQVADLLHIMESTYSHWESGRNEPGIENIRKLCDIFDVGSEELFGR